jgi:RNA polymerase sigma-70 factor, ECF subfamily
MDKTQEAHLIERCRQGDHKAMAILLTEFEKPVYNAAYRMLGNPEDAADVTQTVFLRVFENISTFNPAHRFFSWIYRIAMNESIDQLGRRKSTDLADDSLQSTERGPQQTAAAEQLSAEVQSLLMELSDEHRAVIVLKYFTDFNYQQISKTLKISEKTVKSRLYTARQQMKDRLARHGINAE